ncbi:neutrophil cytosolic factor 1-like isoform X4 [Oscarella lobularis]|uniref:neutrophil cytosolic factor 1-like isoform X4 n=1 Tax=Oscarella lobularis TaxID=121494 RepID=UPI00331424A2
MRPPEDSASPQGYQKLLPSPYDSPYSKPFLTLPAKTSLPTTFDKVEDHFEAIFDYTATHEDELTLTIGDRITVVEKQDDGWWKGECKTKTGWFPASYVEPASVDDFAKNETADADSGIEEEGTEYKVSFPCDAWRDDELTLKEGDLVVVFETADSVWWRGSAGTKHGWFPGSYVETLVVFTLN